MAKKIVYLTTIEAAHVGLTFIKGERCPTCMCSPGVVSTPLGVIQERDIGKRVFKVDGVVQVENDDQRDRRMGKISSPA